MRKTTRLESAAFLPTEVSLATSCAKVHYQFHIPPGTGLASKGKCCWARFLERKGEKARARKRRRDDVALFEIFETAFWGKEPRSLVPASVCCEDFLGGGTAADINRPK
jgi:hypothetical protein